MKGRKGKRSILAFIVVLAVILSGIPAFSLTAYAAQAEVLFDIANVNWTGPQSPLSGEMISSSGNGAYFNAEWHADGTYKKNLIGEKTLMFCRMGAKQNGKTEVSTASFANAVQTEGAKRITVEYVFAAQDGNNYQGWDFIDNDGKVFARVYYDVTKKAAVGIGCGADNSEGVYAGDDTKQKADEVKALRGTSMKIDAVQNEDGKWSVTYYSKGSQVGTVETVDSINGIASIRGTCGQWNDQWASMALMGLKVTYERPLGVSLIDGAQVRIGLGVYSEEDAEVKADPTKLGKVKADLKGSGLRFIAKVDKIDTRAATAGAEVGILIYPAEGTTINENTDFNAEINKENNNIIVIPAVDYQDGDAKSIFTAALTNLKEQNYNRMFTAKPYVKIGDTYYTDDTSVTRSIYQVAAGVMVNNLAGGDVTVKDDTTSTTLEQVVGTKGIDVLNAYLNQVGIRLTINADGTIVARTEGTGAYTGVKYFDVTRTGTDGVYEITLEAKGEKTTFKNFWKEYVRINNNHSAVFNGIDDKSVKLSDDGKKLTFTFNANNAK